MKKMRRIFLILVLLTLPSFTVTEGFAFLSPVTVVASVWGTTQLPQTVEPGARAIIAAISKPE